MKKGILLFVLMSLSAMSYADNDVRNTYNGPDCSKDIDARIVGGIIDSLDIKDEKNNNPTHEKYFEQLIGKNIKRKIVRLSSEKISKAEAKRLMHRSAVRDGISKNDETLKLGGSRYGMYVDEYLYRQYYLIESNKGFKAIAEFYSAYNPGNWPVGDKKAEACAADIENIYIISDHIYGHTEDFASR